MNSPAESTKPAVRLTDSTLRDGSHAVRHQFTTTDVVEIAGALDRAGIQVIEVTHGDGLAGSSFNYGFGRQTDVELVAAAAGAVKRARIAVLLLPGLGTVHDLRQAHAAGASVARIATHSTEADVSVQHFGAARELGMETVGFLMLSHRTSPDALAGQARIMADAGCQCIYVVDSAGALLPDGVQARVEALVAELGYGRGGRLPRPPEPVAGSGELDGRLPRRGPPDRRHAVRAGCRSRQHAHRDPGHRVRDRGCANRGRRRTPCCTRPKRC